MNRRNFLKSLAATCGAAVVAPAVLLKARPKPIEVECEWVHLYDEFHYSNEELIAKKMRQAFRDTKFKQPVPYHLQNYDICRLWKPKHETTEV